MAKNAAFEFAFFQHLTVLSFGIKKKGLEISGILVPSNAQPHPKSHHLSNSRNNKKHKNDNVRRDVVHRLLIQ